MHACRVERLPTWIDEELWVVELDGEVVEISGLLVAQRARLLDHVADWSNGAQSEFAAACADRARLHGGPRAAEAEATARQARNAQNVALVAYMARHAGEDVEPGGFEAERMWQAEWLRERLGLAG